MLHRLLALGVAWGTPEEGRGTSGTFRETWRLAWEPELSIRLVERAGYGTTLDTAATAHLVERAERSTGVIDLIGVLDRALLAQLPAAVEPALRGLARRAATDPDIGHLMDAVGPAGQCDAVRGRARHRAGVDQGAVRRVRRTDPGRGGHSFASLDDVGAGLAVERLSGVQAALGIIDHPARMRRFPAVLAALAAGRGHGLVRGQSTRLLHDSGVWTPEEVERRLSMALSGGTPAATGAAFVEGFLAGSGTVLVHDGELLGVLDTWLSTLTRRRVRQRGGAAAPHVRCVRTGRAAPDHDDGRVRPRRPYGDVRCRRRSERAAAALVTVRHLLGLPIHPSDPPSDQPASSDRVPAIGPAEADGRSRSDSGRNPTGGPTEIAGSGRSAGGVGARAAAAMATRAR